MIINTELIKELFSKQSQADIVRGTGIVGSQISRIKNGETSYQNMRLSTAYTLTVYAEHVLNKRIIIELYKEYDNKTELLGIFLYTDDIVEHLQENDYYEWSKHLDDFEKPDFKNVSTLSKLKTIFDYKQFNGFRLSLNIKR